MLGYDYEITYKKGKEYIVAYALSRREKVVAIHNIFEGFPDLSTEMEANKDLHKLIQDLGQGHDQKEKYQLING